MHGDAELHGLLDQAVGDAGAKEGDDVLRQQVEQFVVATEGGGTAVGVPVRLADDLMAALLSPLRREPLDTGAAAMHQHNVGILGADAVQSGEHGARIADLLAAPVSS